MNTSLSEAELQEIIASYSGQKDRLVDILGKIQQVYKYIPHEAEQIIARELDIPLAQVIGVRSFYSFFHADQPSQYIISVCTSTPCHLNGSNRILAAVTESLHIQPGETTQDGRFRLEICGCLGFCDKAPAIMVNKQLFGPVRPEDVEQILACCI